MRYIRAAAPLLAVVCVAGAGVDSNSARQTSVVPADGAITSATVGLGRRAVAGAATPSPRVVPDDGVLAFASDGDTLYMGGEFERVGPRTGALAVFGRSSDRVDRAYPYFPAGVLAIASDGRGGWFVGGSFKRVDDVSCPHLAHIRADKTLNTGWCPQPDEAVTALTLVGSRLYVGGEFGSVGKTRRTLLAALDARTGAVLAWNPQGSGHRTDVESPRVETVAVAGTRVYVGGFFDRIGGRNRSSLAVLDSKTGRATAWDPRPRGCGEEDSRIVEAIVATRRAIYVGGCFDRIGGSKRRCLAALRPATGRMTGWNPGSCDGFVESLALSGRTLFVGGLFERFGGVEREDAAAFDALTGRVRAWNPRVDGVDVQAMAVSGGSVFLAGDFRRVGGRQRNGLAAVDSRTGRVRSWNPNPDDDPVAIAVAQGRVAVGGHFRSVGNAAARNGIAALSTSSGDLTAWDPRLGCDPTNCVSAIADADSVVYVGGSFRAAGAEARRGLVALDAASGRAEAWDPRPEPAGWCGLGESCTIAPTDSVVYLAGSALERLGGKPRPYLAAAEAATARVTDWNPRPDSPVYAVAPAGAIVYVGGSFTTIGGQQRDYVAAIDAQTGGATAWNPRADGAISAIAVAGQTVYVGGNFTRIGGEERVGLAAIDAASGRVTSWNPNLIYSGRPVVTAVEQIAVVGSTVIIAGTFDRVGDQARDQVAAIEAATGSVKPWNPILDGFGVVGAVEVAGSTLYVGGYFNEILLAFPLADVTR